jgi:predicted transcriptional regulator of viral defense system
MEKLIEKFNNNFGLLKSKEITGRSEWRTLNKMLNDHSASKVKRGLYRINEYAHDNSMIEISYFVSNGVFCMFSAWFFYGLTTTVPYENHIAVTQNRKIKLPEYPPIRLYYLSDKYYQLGIQQVNINNQPVKMYDLEKSVCDAVRFRNKVGMDITIEVVRNYVQRKKDRNFDKLIKYAGQLRIDKLLQSIIMPML